MKLQKPNTPIEGYFRAKRVQHAKTSWLRIMRENLSEVSVRGHELMRSIALVGFCLFGLPFLIAVPCFAYVAIVQQDEVKAAMVLSGIGYLLWGYAATAVTNWFGMNRAIGLLIKKRYADTGLNSLYISDNELRKVAFATSISGFILPLGLLLFGSSFFALQIGLTMSGPVMLAVAIVAALVRYGPQNMIPLIMIDQELSYPQARRRMRELVAGKYWKASVFLAFSNVIWLASYLLLFIPGSMLYDWNQQNLVDLYLDLVRRENPDGGAFEVAHQEIVPPGPAVVR